MSYEISTGTIPKSENKAGAPKGARLDKFPLDKLEVAKPGEEGQRIAIPLVSRQVKDKDGNVSYRKVPETGCNTRAANKQFHPKQFRKITDEDAGFVYVIRVK